MNTQQALQLAFQHLNGGNLAAANQLFNTILQQEPQNFAALNGRGFVALQQNNLQQAQVDLQSSLAINPKQPFAHKMVGIVLGAMGRFEESMTAFESALALDARDPEVYFNRANFRFQAGQTQEALADLDAAIKLKGSYLEARSNRANLLIQQGDFARAEKDLDYLVNKVTNNPDLWVALGLARHKVGKHKESMQCNERALKLVPNHPDALLNSSSATYDQDAYPAALGWAEKAIAVTPQRAEAHYAKAQALMAMHRFDEAVVAYSRAIELSPAYAEAWMGRGLSFASLCDFDQAIENYNSSIRINHNYFEAYNNLGLALIAKGDKEDSIKCFQISIKIKPDNWDSRANLANVFESFGMINEAIMMLEEGVAFSMPRPSIRTLLFSLRMKVCDWRQYDKQLDDVRLIIKNGDKFGTPFFGLTCPLTLREQLVLTKKHASDIGSLINMLPNDSLSKFSGKIRVAYVSSDFCNHPVSHLLAGLFEAHDRGRFEVIAFSLERWEGDEWSDRVAKGVDIFIDVKGRTDSEIALLARELRVDIAIDLNGYTKNARTGVFAHRAAPVQISYIGYLGTMGAPFYDYLIADEILIPKESRQFYAEKIVYMPCYQCNDSKFELKDKVVNRTDYGLPVNGFVFCSFNNNYKITPVVFDCWIRILKAVPRSVLWVYVGNQTAKQNLRQRAAELGLDPARLIFADKEPLEDHILRLALADLFLDSFPYNAGATASNALRVGLPLISLVGESFQSRYGCSLLSAMGLSELVVETIDSYEALAIDLAQNPDKLNALRLKLLHNRSTSPLFDTPRFARNLEVAYEAIWARHQSGLLPDHISV